MSALLRLGVLASGGGTNLQAIIDACQSGKCPAEVVVVISDRADAFSRYAKADIAIDPTFIRNASRMARARRYWLLKSENGQLLPAGTLPAEVALKPGDRSTVSRSGSLRLSQPIEGLTGFLNAVEFDNGEMWIPPRAGDGRFDEAEPLARLGREIANGDDPSDQMLWRRARALVDSSRGHHAEAERLAREAVAITERTDALNWQGDALTDLAEVLHTAGQSDEAEATLTLALERYERKMNLAQAAQTRARLAELRDAAPT